MSREAATVDDRIGAGGMTRPTQRFPKRQRRFLRERQGCGERREGGKGDLRTKQVFLITKTSWGQKLIL